MKRDTVSIFKIALKLSNASGPYVASSSSKNKESKRAQRSQAFPNF